MVRPLLEKDFGGGWTTLTNLAGWGACSITQKKTLGEVKPHIQVEGMVRLPKKIIFGDWTCHPSTFFFLKKYYYFFVEG
jgi:hypothetical protein